MYLQVKIKLLHAVGFFFLFFLFFFFFFFFFFVLRTPHAFSSLSVIVKRGAESWFIVIFVSSQPEQASFDSAHLLLRHDGFFLQGGKLKNFLNPPSITILSLLGFTTVFFLGYDWRERRVLNIESVQEGLKVRNAESCLTYCIETTSSPLTRIGAHIEHMNCKDIYLSVRDLQFWWP